MEVLSTGANGQPTPPTVTSIDPQLIVEYLIDLLVATLGATSQDLERNGSLLSASKKQDTIQRCTRFALESQTVLYVQKDIHSPGKSNGINGSSESSVHDVYTLATEISFSSSTAASVAIMKSPQPIDAKKPISTQLRVINLPGAASLSGLDGTQNATSPFEILYSIIHSALTPYLDAYTRNRDLNNGVKNRVDADARTGVPGTKRKLAELELSFLHLQQNVDIPELYLPFPEIVQETLGTAVSRKVRPTIDLIPSSILSDSKILNDLQNTVNSWIKSIQAITKLSRDPDSGSATQEINFWLSMELALESIEGQLRSDGVQLTMDILKNAKRFQATVSFSADTGLKDASEKVQRYNLLMRDFPLDELLAASSLQKVQDALDSIFNHINKKLRICPYPIARALKLVSAISGDLETQMHKILHGRTLMHLPYNDFRTIIDSTESIWSVWDENVKDFTNVARDVTRKRNEKFIPVKILSRHTTTQDRLKYINTFRVNHEQLQQTIINVLGSKSDNKSTSAETKAHGPVIVEEIGDVDAVDEVVQAYAALKDVDVLDVTEEGTQIWAQAENTYNERTSRVENSIIARLRDRLATAKTANEMFRVFSKFNALFVRPKIRGAIGEYQSQLIESVKKDITGLHERFKHQYGHSEAHIMAQLRDLPAVSGAIIWAHQIERQLDAYMKKVEDVLGKDWALHSEGQKLQAEGNNFRKKLDTWPIFQSWLHDVTTRKISVSGRLFGVSRNRSVGNTMELTVNFDSQVITIFKEVRNLTWLNFQIPHAINSLSKVAKRVYPLAVSLMESCRSLAQTNRVIENMTQISILLNGYQMEVQALTSRGIPLRWESFVHSYDLQIKQVALFPHGTADHSTFGRGESSHVQFVREFSNAVSVLQTKTSALIAMNENIQASIKDLQTCPYNATAFTAHLDSIQTAVDQLNLENYANLHHWVAETNEVLESILVERLQQAMLIWTETFQKNQDNTSLEHTARKIVIEEEKVTRPQFDVLVHEIAMQNQAIYLEPPSDFARAQWIDHLHKWLGVVCNLPVIQSSRYDMQMDVSSTSTKRSFTYLLRKCVPELCTVHDMINNKIQDMDLYVEKWLQFQSLWDLRSENVYDMLGDDLARWLQLLHEIRKTRSTFDTSESSYLFGNVVIEFEQVQAKVNAKYDNWQHEILLNFASRLGLRMRDVYADVERSRKELEGQTLDASSTAQAVSLITVVQQCRRKVQLWEPEINTFRNGQTMLTRQRYQFPADWLFVEQIDREWGALNEILDRKLKLVQDQTDALKAKILVEDKLINEKVAEAITQWNEEKPVSGTVAPGVASAILKSFESRLTKLKAESEMVAKAKEALDLPAGSETMLSAILDEIHDFMSVWAALSTIWNSLDGLKETLWTNVQPRKLRQSIEGLIKMTKEMPSRMRQYAAFEHIQSVLRQLLKAYPIVTDLKSEAIRERHWTKILKSLKPGKRYSPLTMTLGEVWDLELIASEKIIRNIIVQAQGELALEEFLRQVRDTWQNYSLDLVNYQNKCRLIRGWDDLFAKCSENLNSLQAMRHSPYYKEFEEDASSWEEKLNRVHVLFDVWIDVQRQWVYLEGVFTGNADIKHLLPVESSRFQNINTEFFAILKKVNKSPLVLDVLQIPGAQKSLERLAELLNKIQKALGEYLERERISFPRFYFVGDEDLLEIIGNSNDTLRVSKHLRKMFAGLSGLLMESHSIVGFTSKEGEEVRLKKGVSLTKIPKINDWLAALEANMKSTLAELLAEAVDTYQSIVTAPEIDQAAFHDYMTTYPAQIVVLATQAIWTTLVEDALAAGGENLRFLFDLEVKVLELLAQTVLGDLDYLYRKSCEHLITEFVHQRDVIGRLIEAKASSSTHYQWLIQMRYVYSLEGDFVNRLHVKMANADLTYGFEYLGVAERLVRTPLTDRCFLTLTQAIAQRLGGSPYGPAGTGKTESVKALGSQLGRFTLVFCCDDTFDFQAMGRILLGICQVGAWGCFDEFNRLEERILSAVSQQVQNIQVGLKKGSEDSSALTELAGRQFRVNPNTGIFITMNPGYAGRSNLPDNLKKLFRSVAMSKPDKELIAEVMLYSQGFKHAKQLSKQAVPFFDQCSSGLSKQAHYDFGLRALKSVLISSGSLKRARLSSDDTAARAEKYLEPQIIVQSIHETIAPKLIREDVQRMVKIESSAFPGIQYIPASLEQLQTAIRLEATEQHLVINNTWMTKILQLYQIQNIHHGVMMVGDSGSGKSAIWKVLLRALHKIEGVEGVFHIIDSKVMSKEALYGSLDSTTREWTDGLFTGILRKIVDNLRGEDSKRHWIVFDGDVDPDWVENLNSVLDDNKILTLPNGERLNLPPNVRIMFEVETLKYATLATVSRCGMVWFSEDTVTPEMIFKNYLQLLRSKPFDELDEDIAAAGQAAAQALPLQIQMADVIQHHLGSNNMLESILTEARKFNHIMQFTDIRVLNTLFSLLNKACRNMIEYNLHHEDFPLEAEQVYSYVSKKLLLAVVWALTGDCPLKERKVFGEYVTAFTTTELPLLDEFSSLIDYDVSLPKAEWSSWQSQVPNVEINTHSVTQTDVVIPTLDTVRHEDILYSWLAEHKPLILCGPPGSGKTMTLFSALRKLPNMEVVGLNFSSATTPDLLIKTFDQYCEYRKTLNGVIMSPNQIGRWLVLFCDEINLPAPDKYGTQRAINFLRQLIEQNGFWRTSDKTWVTLERIQFVGACNPPTDTGRTPMTTRFLRHAPLVMVDYPGELSLYQIYGTFNSAVLKVIPNLRGYAQALTKAMVQLYIESQARFTPKIQPHYVYSPRELTRWVRGIYEAIKPLETLSVEGLVRIWAHEALRLFQDRLVTPEERQWTDQATRRIALEHFLTVDEEAALKGPILFSNWLSKNYIPVEREELRNFVKARLKTFCEEEVDVPLILFNDVLEHVLRIDRVFRQPQGHLILIGVSGSGKTTLSRFVAWMNGLKVFQIKVHGKYSGEDFDDDLRDVLRRAGCKGEKICFIMDESNVLDSGFLERMNTLLANAEIPGLFEGDDYAALMTACKEGAQRQGLLLDSQEEMYKWFTQQIIRNLHVVFTMNPPEDGLSSKAATSPALFNRCVLNWFGDWSEQALFQVGSELTQSVDLDRYNFVAPDTIPVAYQDLLLPASHRDTIMNSMVYVHISLRRFDARLKTQQGRVNFLTPRHFLDFVAQFVRLSNEKREDLEEQQRHLNVGLEKLRDTVEKVRDLRASLAQKKAQLELKDAEANEKLQRMIADQREAEQRKAISLKIQANLDKQEEEVAKRKEVVNADLEKAEPAVLAAQESVSNIKKGHLTEVRSMANPPAGVKSALEAVCTLLGHKVDSWKAIQAIVRREDFIASIVGYDNERQMTRSHRIKMQNEFLSKDDFTYERVNRASKACGPLVQWVEAQVNYSSILDRVGPLREEANQLEEQALQTKAEAKAIEKNIADLERSIATYKSEYAALISETQAIKSEMSRVQFKVERSVKLLDSLSSERSRWEDGSKSFESQIDTMVGDVLVAAAFLAYGGLYDQQFRKAMTDDWLEQLALSGVKYNPHHTITEFLSSADDRLQWQEDALPVDELCTENAIILKRFNRYPLIIDPSGRATEFLQNQNKSRRMTVTSFLDDSFIKQLESALRFGNTILIQDAEHLDPVLNHVLNKEYQKTGGRVLIQLGKQEIDFSPAFRLFLSTRDPSAMFPPDVCSRTTFVNFTITQSSLQTQSLNEVLKSERPDVDERRSNLLKMQGQFNVHLRGLEKRLLQALNESRGNILDDDVVIETLEKLKKEAEDISHKMAETDGVMSDVEAITLHYSTIARACSTVFSVLEQLHHLNHFYQFSLQFFIDIFHSVLHNNPNLSNVHDHTVRGKVILQDLFTSTYQRTSLSLLQHDRITLAMLLAKASPYEMDKGLIDTILDPSIDGYDISTNPGLLSTVMTKAASIPSLKKHLPELPSSAWDKFRSEESAENVVPKVWDERVGHVDRQLRSLLLVKLFRIDRFIPAAEKFVTAVFSKHLLEVDEDLKEVVQQVSPMTPIALCSSPGFDASYKVDILVERQRANCTNIAMGSAEGLTSADKAISNAAAVGSWVLVKNVHLAPMWLQSLEKRLDTLKPHPDFRLMLSMESSPKIPVNLLRASRVIMYEQPAGIRANMKDSLSSLSRRTADQPVEKARLYLLLSFLHAVIQERLRYAPMLGWKGFWEFNDSDYECAAFIIDTWISSMAQGRTNITPGQMPWDLIRNLITETYGGKIDDDGDFNQLRQLVGHILTLDAYELDYKLVKGSHDGEAGLTVPEGTSMKVFMEWVNRLPEREPPTYLGLPANAEKMLLVGQGKNMISNLAKIVDLLEEGEQIWSGA